MVHIICTRCGEAFDIPKRAGRRPKFCTACAFCAIELCDRSVHARGLCNTHYNGHREGGSRCTTDGCDRPVAGRGLCSKHYAQQHGGRTYYAIICEGCGRAAQVRRKGSRFCSVRCYNVTVGHQVDADRSQAYREKRRRDRCSRRARERDAYRAEVVPRRVFEADGYRCHLCKRKCDRAKEVPHPKAPTVDHVVPLSDGGLHLPENCRTACFRCNNSKGSRGGGEQLLLVAV